MPFPEVANKHAVSILYTDGFCCYYFKHTRLIENTTKLKVFNLIFPILSSNTPGNMFQYSLQTH